MKFDIKKSLRHFAGIYTEEERQQKEKRTPAQKFKDFIESLLFAAVAAFIIITFVVQNTRIPTGSMEDTILPGDFVLVNKFIYGSSSPRYIPFTEVALPYFTLPALAEPERGDIVVFEWPGMRDQLYPDQRGVNYVKRCIGTPGDTIEIRDKVVFVNGEEFWIPPYIKYLSPRPKPASNSDSRIFPAGSGWNEDNYGPLYIPKKGDVIELTFDNINKWRTIIDREFGERVVDIENGKITIQGKPVTSYTLTRDYFFMMGDNRDDSLDSRYWGFVSRDDVVGSAFIILLSWNRDIPMTQPLKLLGSIRFERMLRLLD